MKVFISGPMSGKPNDNVEAFHNAEVELKRRGYSVWNPAWQQFSDDTDFTREDIHDIDLRALEKCDAIYMLDGWEGSNGARVEYSHARALGKKIMYECLFSDNEWRKDIDERIEKLKEKITKLDIDSYNNLDDLRKKLFNEKQELQEQLDKDFDDVYTEFQSTKDQVNDINMGYIKWSSEVSQFDERIEKLEENMKEIAANGGLGLSFNLMNERVSSNKRDISSLRNDIDDIHNWINAHDKILEEQSKQMSDLGSELDEYIDDYKEAYKHLDNADEALERRIKALETKLSSLLQGYNSTLNRLKAIEKRLSIKPFYEPTEDEKDDD